MFEFYYLSSLNASNFQGIMTLYPPFLVLSKFFLKKIKQGNYDYSLELIIISFHYISLINKKLFLLTEISFIQFKLPVNLYLIYFQKLLYLIYFQKLLKAT